MCERADGEGHGGSASAPRTCVAVGIASSAVHRARCESDPSRPPAASDCRPGRAAAPRATHACTGTTHQHAPAARQRHEPCRVRAPPASAAALRTERISIFFARNLVAAGRTRTARGAGPARCVTHLGGFLRAPAARHLQRRRPGPSTCRPQPRSSHSSRR